MYRLSALECNSSYSYEVLIKPLTVLLSGGFITSVPYFLYGFVVFTRRLFMFSLTLLFGLVCLLLFSIVITSLVEECFSCICVFILRVLLLFLSSSWGRGLAVDCDRGSFI